VRSTGGAAARTGDAFGELLQARPDERRSTPGAHAGTAHVELTTRSAELMRENQSPRWIWPTPRSSRSPEAEHHDKIFTLDPHFRTYRLRDRRHLKLVPD
jgi:hypothetical protein